MKILNNRKLRYQVLRTFYQLAPFPIKGGLTDRTDTYRKNYISCLIVSNKISLLKDLLQDLKLQTLPKDKFEVVLVFDAQGTGIINTVKEYEQYLNIIIHQTNQPIRVLSDLRNISISLSQGEILLFLDDDTRIFQNNFLELSFSFFKEYDCQVLIPQAHSLFGIVGKHYDFLDKFSFTNRCSLYHKRVIENLGGFLKGLPTYEDTELSIRLMIKELKIICAEELNYYHPPLYFASLRKPLAIGQAIFQMGEYYSLPFWLLVYFNALRFLPFWILPGERLKGWAMISLGVFLYPFKKKEYCY